jgi:hypothetical protein
VPSMAALGHGLPSRLGWHQDRCTSDSRRLAATPKSAESGQKLSFLGLTRDGIRAPDSDLLSLREKGAFKFVVPDASLG